MYAVLGLRQVLGAMQDDAAADSPAIRRVFFKKEAVRLAVIINDDLGPFPAYVAERAAGQPHGDFSGCGTHSGA